MVYWFSVFPGIEMLGIYFFYSELLHRVNTPKASELLHNVNGPKTLGHLLAEANFYFFFH